MIYVFLDTCIFNRIVTQGQPGCTVECFEELKKLAQEGKIRVIVPEVVVLEFEKFCGELDDKLRVEIDGIKTDVGKIWEKKPKPWNEIDDLKQSLVAHVEAEAAKKKAAFPDRIKAVRDWLHSEAAVSVPYDQEIMLKAKRRLMSGRMPPTEQKSDQDASIIESVLKVLPKGEELYFASGNAKDFAVEVPNKGIALHPLLAGDLPKTKFFTDLCSLVEATKSGKTPPEPTVEEAKEAAREKSLAAAVSQAVSISDELQVIVHRVKSVTTMLVLIAGKLTELGISSDVREKICADLSRKNLNLAERYLVVRANGWNVFADDATPFMGLEGYFVIDWRTL